MSDMASPALLRKYYDDQFKQDVDCPFDELADKDKDMLYNSFAFSAWALNYHANKSFNEIIECVKRIKKIGAKK